MGHCLAGVHLRMVHPAGFGFDVDPCFFLRRIGYPGCHQGTLTDWARGRIGRAVEDNRQKAAAAYDRKPGWDVVRLGV